MSKHGYEHHKQTFLTRAEPNGNGVDDASCVITATASDRDGDIVVPEGMDLTHFKSNPVVLFGHDYSGLPVGRCTKLTVTKDGIRASWNWLKNDERADRVANAWKQGCLNATSVGFRIIKAEPRSDGGGGRLFTKTELLEFSVVPVPANPLAVKALKDAGLWNSETAAVGRILAKMREVDIQRAFDDRDVRAKGHVLAALAGYDLVPEPHDDSEADADYPMPWGHAWDGTVKDKRKPKPADDIAVDIVDDDGLDLKPEDDPSQPVPSDVQTPPHKLAANKADIDEADVAAALAGVIEAAVAERNALIQRETDSAIARLRGRMGMSDDPVVRRHALSEERALLAGAMQAAINEALAEVIASETDRVLRAMRGRLD